MLVVLLVFTIGISIDMHFCGTMKMGTSINGFAVNTAQKELPETCSHNKKDCGRCHNKHLSYKILAEFMQGQSISVLATHALLSINWAPFATQNATFYIPIKHLLLQHYRGYPPPLLHAYIATGGIHAPPFLHKA